MPYNLLILGTGNSARSIMAEALFNLGCKGRLVAYSGGSQPTGQVHPFALELLKPIRYPTESLRNKSWKEFAQSEGPEIDFIITVCDKAASEICLLWPGKPASAHWDFEDPAAIEGDDEVKRQGFGKVFNKIMVHVVMCANLPLEKLNKAEITREFQAIRTTPHIHKPV